MSLLEIYHLLGFLDKNFPVVPGFSRASAMISTIGPFLKLFSVTLPATGAAPLEETELRLYASVSLLFIETWEFLWFSAASELNFPDSELWIINNFSTLISRDGSAALRLSGFVDIRKGNYRISRQCVCIHADFAGFMYNCGFMYNHIVIKFPNGLLVWWESLIFL